MKYTKITCGFKSGTEKSFVYPFKESLDYYYQLLALANNAKKKETTSILTNVNDYCISIVWSEVEWFEAELMDHSLGEEDGEAKVNIIKKTGNIKKNKAKCLHCGDEIESFHKHDFKQCSCENIFVDGGLEYIRHGFVNFEKYEDISE